MPIYRCTPDDAQLQVAGNEHDTIENMPAILLKIVDAFMNSPER